MLIIFCTAAHHTHTLHHFQHLLTSSSLCHPAGVFKCATAPYSASICMAWSSRARLALSTHGKSGVPHEQDCSCKSWMDFPNEWMDNVMTELHTGLKEAAGTAVPCGCRQVQVGRLAVADRGPWLHTATPPAAAEHLSCSQSPVLPCIHAQTPQPMTKNALHS